MPFSLLETVENNKCCVKTNWEESEDAPVKMPMLKLLIKYYFTVFSDLHQIPALVDISAAI